MLKIGEFYKAEGFPYPCLNGIYLCVDINLSDKHDWNYKLENIVTKKRTYYSKVFVAMLEPLTEEEKLELL